MYVKICGLSTIESARVALDAGADAVGVVMSRRSRRTVSADVAREIAGFIGGAADVVLVVDELPAAEAAAVAGGIGADVVQLHGAGYRPDDVAAAAGAGLRVWRATSVTSADEVDVGSWGEEALLLDSPDPGSGRRWDFAVLGGRPPARPVDARGRPRPRERRRRRRLRTPVGSRRLQRRRIRARGQGPRPHPRVRRGGEDGLRGNRPCRGPRVIRIEGLTYFSS